MERYKQIKNINTPLRQDHLRRQAIEFVRRVYPDVQPDDPQYLDMIEIFLLGTLCVVTCFQEAAEQGDEVGIASVHNIYAGADKEQQSILTRARGRT